MRSSGDLDHARTDGVLQIADVEVLERGAEHRDSRIGECRDGEQRRLHPGAHMLQPLRDRVRERARDRQPAPIAGASRARA